MKNGSWLELKNTYSIYKLRMNVVFRNAVLIIPIIATAAFIKMAYAVTPTQVSGSFLLSGVFLFLCMTFLAQCIQDRENDVHEEILLLHSKSDKNFYMSRELVLLSILLVFAIVLTFYPVMFSMRCDHVFSRPLEVNDVIFGGIIILSNGLCGFTLGDFFHQRIQNERKHRIILVIFFILVSVCKTPLIHKFSAFKFLNILLPPVVDALDMVGDTDRFDKMGTIGIFIHSIIFAIVITLLKNVLLKKRKFNS